MMSDSDSEHSDAGQVKQQSDFEEEDQDADFIRDAALSANRKHRKSGGFQNMGLSSIVFNAIIKKGYKVPTPIQRKTIPMIMQGKDVVAMARTGSGKTAAFLIPMLEKLKAHTVKVGPRAIILSPSRELAMQTIKFAKEIGRFSDLRCAIIVGGDSIEEQFSQMASNPDIIIATPGRLLHLLMEMSLDLSTVEYLVFDEADRLFEMGFSEAINEIIHRIPSGRQTVLFSATLPKLLVDFAKAGLHNPVLVRLDVDSKVSPELSLAFFPVKPDAKEAALLFIISNVIKPEHQTIIFVATRHHVEYIHELLQSQGIENSYIYGSLDMTARKLNLAKFREGKTKYLVVTDVAARGIDIPFLNNVIHYDFSDKCKLFVHRSGRAARAGRIGTAYSFITNDDMPYLVDLHLFLGRPLVLGGHAGSQNADLSKEMLFADLPSSLYTDNAEHVRKLLSENATLDAMRNVSLNGFKLYFKTRSQASRESYGRAKQLMEEAPIGSASLGIHPAFAELVDEGEVERVNVMDQLRNFRPTETIFEMRKMGFNAKKSVGDGIMKSRRSTVGSTIQKARQDKAKRLAGASTSESSKPTTENTVDEEEIQSVFTVIGKKREREESGGTDSARRTYRDPEFYIPHKQHDFDQEREYAIDTGVDSFAKTASTVQMDLTGDDKDTLAATARNGKLTWDKKKRRFTRATVGADNKKMIRSETGALLPSSYKTDAYNRWQKKTKTRLPRAGDTEIATTFASNTGLSSKERKYRHTSVSAPKALDPKSNNYEKKLQYQKKKNVLKSDDSPQSNKTLQRGVKSELKSADVVKKERQDKEKRREKNARPSKNTERGREMFNKGRGGSNSSSKRGRGSFRGKSSGSRRQ